MTEKILDRLYRIPVPLPNNPLRELNAYLIRGKDGSLLIDTGFRLPECRAALQAGLDELGVDRRDLVVLLTHMHSDHAGLAPEFVGEGNPILVSEGDRALLGSFSAAGSAAWNRTNELFLEAGFPPELLKDIERTNPARAYAPISTDRYESIRDGQMLEFGGYRLQAISVPGHTPGQMCFWLEEAGVMFTGDHVLFDITPNITGWPGVEDSLGNYLNSLRLIRRYDVRLALPGHRKPGPMRERIDELIEHHERRMQEVRDIILKEPGLDTYGVTARMTWSIRAKSWEDFPVAQKWFAVGECAAHLDYLLVRKEIRRELDSNGIYHYFMNSAFL